jgi:hypothetical protein
MMEFVQACRVADVNKNDRRPVHKPASGNRPRERVFHGRVRRARAHTALGTSWGLFFPRFLPGECGAEKQCRTNGLYRGSAEKTPRLAGSREWYDAQLVVV